MKHLFLYNLSTGIVIIGLALANRATESGQNDYIFLVTGILILPLSIIFPLVGGYLANKLNWVSLKNSFLSVIGIIFGLSLGTSTVLGPSPSPGLGSYVGIFILVFAFTSIPLYFLLLLGQLIWDKTKPDVAIEAKNKSKP